MRSLEVASNHSSVPLGLHFLFSEHPMHSTIKALLAKVWKDQTADLGVGTHFIDEEIVVRISGTVEKFDDQLVAPTVSIPLIPTIALFWEKAGIARDEAMSLLREAIAEAMKDGVHENHRIKAQIDDVTKAIEAVRNDLIAQLPKTRRSGRINTKHLRVSLSSLNEVEEPMAIIV
jgi:hypothetical protein